MWTILSVLVSFLGAVKCNAVDQITLDDRNDLKATRDVSPAELDFINDMARHSAIAHCENLDPQFNCTAGCQNSANVTLIQKFRTTDFAELDGYVARDDGEKWILIALRGTHSPRQSILNALSLWSPHQVVPEQPECRVHWGFHIAYEKVKNTIMTKVVEQIAQYPDYRLVITGHSLGGAIGTLLGIYYLRLEKDPMVVTFGQPRVGNEEFAAYVNSTLVEPGKLYRVTYGNDPVVHLPMRNWGFEHCGGEYWIHSHRYPLTVHDIQVCPTGEDPRCLCGQDVKILNADHMGYFPDGLDCPTPPKI